MEEAFSWAAAHWVEVLGYALWGASELIRKNPKWESNSVVDLAMRLADSIHNWGKKEEESSKDEEKESDTKPEEGSPASDSE